MALFDAAICDDFILSHEGPAHDGLIFWRISPSDDEVQLFVAAVDELAHKSGLHVTPMLDSQIDVFSLAFSYGSCV